MPEVSPPGLALIEDKLRGLIHWRDILAAELARIEAAIQIEGRAYADATGVKVRPTIEQLRRQVNEKEAP